MIEYVLLNIILCCEVIIANRRKAPDFSNENIRLCMLRRDKIYIVPFVVAGGFIAAFGAEVEGLSGGFWRHSGADYPVASTEIP